ncbi:MAG: tRNA (N6-threonylcarbamoyladenosine(37)-N6)-methyltransferase TrmO [bacterium]|nr:tRNA (N6-threonylcarbamoyladenosine(37)-N6)-methyltransferase TrmO [bacterium]
MTATASGPKLGSARIEIKPIGLIHTDHKERKGTPIQPGFGQECEGEIVLDPEYAPGLTDLAGFERIWLIYHFHSAESCKLEVVPFRDTVKRGIFATRAPLRPNHIGLSAVRLISITGNRIRFSGADMLDGTPLLDIKPYSPLFDSFPDAKDGWLAAKTTDRTRADERFDGE